MSSTPKNTRGAKSAAQQSADIMSAAASKAQSTFNDAAQQIGSAAEAAFSNGKFEIPETIRSLAEQGLAQSREAYSRIKTAAEEATGMVEDSLENTRASLRDVQSRAIDSAKAHADASFELARKLLTTNSVSEAMQLQAAYARERFDALVDYSKEMQGLLSKATEDATRPAKTMIERTLNPGKND